MGGGKVFFFFFFFLIDSISCSVQSCLFGVWISLCARGPTRDLCGYFYKFEEKKKKKERPEQGNKRIKKKKKKKIHLSHGDV